MTIRNDLTTSWSTDIGPVSFATPIQCRKGFVFVSWGSPAPGTIQNSFLLGPGESIVLPAGSTFRLARNASEDHEVFYESFTA